MKNKKNKTQITIQYLYRKNQLSEVWIFSPGQGVIYASLVTPIKTIEMINLEIKETTKNKKYQKKYIYK